MIRVIVIPWLGDHGHVLVQSGIQESRLFETGLRSTTQRLHAHIELTHTSSALLLSFLAQISTTFRHGKPRTYPRSAHELCGACVPKPSQISILTDSPVIRQSSSRLQTKTSISCRSSSLTSVGGTAALRLSDLQLQCSLSHP